MARHGFVFSVVQCRDEGLSIGKMIDQNAIPVSLTDEIAFRGRQKCRRAADFSGSFGERLGIADVGCLTVNFLTKFWIFRFVLSLNSKLQQVYLGDGAIVRVIPKGTKLVGSWLKG